MIIVEVLDAAGVEIHYQQNKDEVNICCPFCPERGETVDNRFRLGINVRNGSAQCFNCKWKARGVMYTGRELSRAFHIKFSARREKKVKPPKKQVHKLIGNGLPSEYERFSQEPDDIQSRARSYLLHRNVSTLQIVKHRIGYAGAGAMSWRVLFPVIDRDGIIHGCVGRDFSGNQSPKYLNTPGMKLLWNAQRIATTAVVVEGVMDALRVEKALLQLRDVVAVARLGSSITSLQLDQLKTYERVIVFPDWDRAGVLGARELCGRCDARGIHTSVIIPEAMSGIDPGAMDEETIMDHLRNAVVWSKTADGRLRLASTREQDED